MPLAVELHGTIVGALEGDARNFDFIPSAEGKGDKATVIFDEEYGSRLARRLGLASFETRVEEFDGLATLVIERYDRVGGRRVHQEDLSQALGASGNEKYQEIGGVGNLDMHTKNIGLLHPTDGPVRLAPAYDVVPQAHMKNDGKLALAVNRKYRHADVTGDDLLAELTSWGLSRAAATMADTLDQLAEAAKEEAPLEGAFPALQEQILGFIETLRVGAV
jgi:serine/threonine-protein kinase HipA